MDYTLRPPHLIKHTRSKSSITRPARKEHHPSLSKIRDMTQFIICEKIGQGTFASVRLGTHILTSEQVAIKILDKSKIRDNKDKGRIDREISILKTLIHPNIVQLYTVITTPVSINLIQEYINGQNFSEYLSTKGRLDEEEACKYFQQLISAVEYIHKNKVSHRDLKPENIIITKDKDLKILDFGLSNYYYGKATLLETPCGSPYYAAPEMLQGNDYSGICVDIWSCGIILYVMLCGFLPFDADTHINLYKKIISGKFTLPNFLSKLAKDLIGNILVTSPKKRFKTSQIKAHPWLNLSDKSKNYYKGIDLKQHVIPIDENIVKEMESYGYDKKEIKVSVLSNARNHITTSYYLLLKKKVRNGEDSIAYFKSKLYSQYIMDPLNQLSNYNNDIKQVINQRSSSTNEKEMNSNNNDQQSAQNNVQQPLIDNLQAHYPSQDNSLQLLHNKSDINIKMSQLNATHIKSPEKKPIPSYHTERITPRDKRQLSLSIDKHSTSQTKLKKSLLKYPSLSSNSSLNSKRKISSSMIIHNKNKTPIQTKRPIDKSTSISTLNNTPKVRIGLYKYCSETNHNSIKSKILKYALQKGNKTERTNYTNKSSSNTNNNNISASSKQIPLTERDGNISTRYNVYKNVPITKEQKKGCKASSIGSYNKLVQPQFYANMSDIHSSSVSYKNSFAKSKERDCSVKNNTNKSNKNEITNNLDKMNNSSQQCKRIRVNPVKPFTVCNGNNIINHK